MGTRIPIKRIWVGTVEAQQRIRVDAEALAEVGFIKRAESTPVKLLPGAHGQLQVTPPDFLTAPYDRLQASVTENPPRPEEATAAWMALARFAASEWPTSFQYEPQKNRYTLSLPRELRAIGLAPKHPESVVLVAVGSILELWTAPRFAEYIARVRADWHTLAETIEEDVANRD